MKKVLAVLLAMAMMMAAMAGCGSGEKEETKKPAETAAGTEAAGTETKAEEGTEAPAAKDGKKEVAVLIGDMTATYASWLAQSFEEIAADYPELNVTIIDNKNSVETQVANLENCVTKQYDYVIIQPIDNEALVDPINQTIDAGIPVCTVNGTNEGSELASCVDCDPVQQGSIPAEVALKNLPDDAKVVVLLGPSGNVHSIGRREGFQKTLFDAKPGIEILDEQIANWYKDEGMALMENWLQKYERIDAVISMNDAMALGCIEAAKSVGREKEMTYYGVDGLADACLSIQDGELTATCVQNAYAQAEASLDIASRVLKGEIDHETNLVDGELIDSSNVAEWIEVHTKNGQIQ